MVSLRTLSLPSSILADLGVAGAFTGTTSSDERPFFANSTHSLARHGERLRVCRRGHNQSDHQHKQGKRKPGDSHSQPPPNCHRDSVMATAIGMPFGGYLNATTYDDRSAAMRKELRLKWKIISHSDGLYRL